MDKVYVLITTNNQFLGVYRTRQQATEARSYEECHAIILEEELEEE